jgi:hypothetical protein
MIENLVNKMGATFSDEVRHRNLSTLVTKARTKLLDLDELCATNPEVSSTLLYWMQDFYQTPLLDRAVWLLSELTKVPAWHPTLASKYSVPVEAGQRTNLVPMRAARMDDPEQ